MDAALFTKMLSDKNVLDLRGLGYQFLQADIKEFTELLSFTAAQGFLRAEHRLSEQHCAGAPFRRQGAFDAAEQHPALRGQGHGGGDRFHLHY